MICSPRRHKEIVGDSRRGGLHTLETVHFLNLPAKFLVLPAQGLLRQGIFDANDEFLFVTGLEEIVPGTVLHSLHVRIQRTVAGDQYHHGMRIETAGLLHHGQTVRRVHDHVGHHHIEAIVLQQRDGLGAAGCRDHRTAGLSPGRSRRWHRR